MQFSARALGRRARWTAVALAVLSITCGEPVTAPHGARQAVLQVAPVWPAFVQPGSLVAAQVDNVQITVHRMDQTVAASTIVAFPAADDTLAVTLRFDIRGSSEDVVATIDLRDGTEVLFSGTQQLTAVLGTAGGSGVEIQTDYVGEGADAVLVDVTPALDTIASRDSIAFTAEAQNALEQVVNAPIEWTVLPGTLGTIDSVGFFRGAAVAGTATITATTPTGIVGTATLVLTPSAQSMAAFAGDAQLAAVTAPFADSLVAVVLDGATPVPGTVVTWSVTAGLAALSATSDTADANGRVQVAVTADTLAGAITVRALAGGSIQQLFNLTALTGAPDSIAIVAGAGQSVNAGLALPVRPAVVLRDQYNNPVPGVDVTFAITAGGGALGAPTIVATSAAGQAEGPTWTLGPVPGTQRVAATAGGLTAEFVATALVPPTMTLVIVSGDAQTGAPGTPLAAPLVVRVANSGTPVEDVPVAFVVTGGGGLLSADTVLTDAAGDASVTFSPGSVGVQGVRASVSPLQVDFSAVGAPSGFTHIWLGLTDDWENTANWTGGVVPTAGDSTYIPATSPNAPRLTADAATAAFVLDDARGIDLATFTFAAHGDVRSLAGWTGTGVLELHGVGAEISGTLPKTTVYANTSLDAGVTITDTLRIRSSATLSIGGHAMQVGGALHVFESGQLAMADPLGSLTVARDATFDAQQSGVLTAGLLELHGDFTATACCTNSFFASGTHITRLAGPQLQTISFGIPGDGTQRFQHLEFDNAAGIQLLSNVYAHGNVTVDNATPVTQSGTRTLFVGGFLFVDAASALTLGTVQVYGGDAPMFPVIAGGQPTTLRIASGGLISVNDNVSLTSNLVVENNATLDIGQYDVAVAGTFDALGGGRLRMNHTLGSVTIAGNATFNGSDMGDSLLTAGLLDFKGNFTSTSCCVQSFRATGTHLTRFSGSAPQTISVGFTSDGQSRFQHLELDNAAGVQLLTNVFVRGDASLIGTTPLSQSGVRTLSVGSTLTTDPGTSITVGTVTVYGGDAPAFPEIGGGWPATLRLSSGTLIALPHADTVPGALVLEANTAFDVLGHTLGVGGTLQVIGGARLRMLDPAAYVSITGTASFNGSDMGDSLLTAGLLDFKGNFSSSTCCIQSFRAAGAHRTRFNGSGLQTISIGFAADAQSRFNRLELDNAAGVQLNSAVHVRDSLVITAGTPVTESGVRTLFAGGAMVTGAGSTLGVSTVTVYGGSAPGFPEIGGTWPTNFRLASGTAIALPHPDTVASNFFIESSTGFDVGGHTFDVTGTTTLGSSGRLKMVDPAALVTLHGAVSFNSADMGDSLMTAGTLQLKGNFTATSCCSQAFRATGTHLTRFNGSALQTVSFAFAADVNSRFQDLELDNAAGVQMNSNVVVRGDLDVAAGTPLTENGVRTLFVGGQLTTAATSALTLSTLEIYPGAAPAFPDVQGTWPATLRFTVGDTLALPVSDTVPSNVVIQSSTVFDVGANTLDIGGTLTLASSGRLLMQDPAAVVVVGGDATFNAIDMGDNDLTAGLLVLKGNFIATSCCSQAFRATGSHWTRFAGSAPQTMSASFPAPTNTRFNRVELANPNGVELLSAIFVHDTLLVTSGTQVTENGVRTLNVGGALIADAGTDIAVSTIRIYGGAGPVYPQFDGAWDATLRFSGTGLITLPQSVALPGQLVIEDNAAFDLGANSLNVAGNFTTQAGGRLRMLDPSGVLTVFGTATFNANDMGDTLLTAGTLDLKGNFSATTASSQSFRAAGSHLTRFSGSASQSVNFGFAGDASSRFFNLELDNANGVVLTSSAVAAGAVTVTAGTPLTESGVRTFSTGGALTSGAGSALTVSTLSFYGTAPLPSIGGTFPTLLRMNTGQLYTLAAPYSVGTSLELAGGTTIDVAAQSLTVSGNANLVTAGHFQMRDPAGVVAISGNVTFNGFDHPDTVLTAGVLEVGGDFTATTCCSQAFNANGTHLVRLNGTGPQLVSFGFPGATNTRFRNLEIVNQSAAGVTMTSSGYVSGTMAQLGRFTLSPTRTLTIVGVLTLGSGSITDVTSATMTAFSCVDQGLLQLLGPFSCP